MFKKPKRIKYFKTDVHLIQYNMDTDVYKIRNTNSKEKVLTKEQFEALNAQKVNHQEFSRLMNVYYKNNKESWIHDGVSFRKLDNFETEGSPYSYSNMPDHNKNNEIASYLGKLILVYHWGKVYYFTWSYNGYAQGQLIDPYTKLIVRWAQAKHCAPVFNEQTKQVC